MLTTTVSVNRVEFRAQLDRAGQRGRVATAKALTFAAEKGQGAAKYNIAFGFDRPTPYAIGGVWKRTATEQRLVSAVYLKDEAPKGNPAAKFLAPEIVGGERSRKRFESALQQRGLMPSGMVAIPGSAAEIDQYGNMSRAQVVRLLSYFGAQNSGGYTSKISEKRKKTLDKAGIAYFVGRPGKGLPLGIWERRSFALGSAVRPIVIFVSAAHYRVRLPFADIVRETVEREFPGIMARSLERELASA